MWLGHWKDIRLPRADNSFGQEGGRLHQNQQPQEQLVSKDMAFLSGLAEFDYGMAKGRSVLHWELQPKKSVLQWKGPKEVDFVLKRVSDKAQAERGRIEMKKICNQCPTSRWTDGYFVEFDKVVSDYNMVWAYTDNLLKEAYAEGLASKDNPIDETPEIQHYLIWHHDGRCWRMGASMMGPAGRTGTAAWTPS